MFCPKIIDFLYCILKKIMIKTLSTKGQNTQKRTDKIAMPSHRS